MSSAPNLNPMTPSTPNFPISVSQPIPNNEGSRSITVATEINSFVDRLKIQEAYKARNKDNPLKAVKLYSRFLESTNEILTLMETVGAWRNEARQKRSETQAKQSNCSKDSTLGKRLLEEEKQFNLLAEEIYSLMAMTLNSKINTPALPQQIHVIEDASGRIQAVGISSPNEDGVSWKIDLLATAPHNVDAEVNSDCSFKVKGVGSALIEEMIFAKFKDKATPVKVYSHQEAISYYEGLGFKPFEDRPKDLVLEGQALHQFIQIHAGRASLKPKSND